MRVLKNKAIGVAQLGSALAALSPVTVLVASFAMPSIALAQSRSTGTGQSQGRQISVTASARLQYDDNVVLNDNRIAAGQTKGDFSTAPSLAADIYLPRATGDFYLRGSAGYNFYRRYTGLNRESIDLVGGADQKFASCITHAEVGYSRRLSDIGNLLPQDATGSFRNTEERRDYTADIGCGGQIGLRPSVAVNRSELRNSASARRFVDSNTNSVTAQLGLASPVIGTVSVFGRYSDSSYIFRETADGGKDGLTSYAAGVQLERAMGTRLNFRGSVNYTKADPKLEAARSFTGIGYDLDATYRGDLFTLVVAGSRVAQPSQLLFVSYDIQTSLTASLTRRLSQRTQLVLGGSYLHREFTSSPLSTLAPGNGSDENFTLSAGARYQASRRLRFSLDGSYQKRTSSLQLFQYDVKRVSLTTSLSL